MYNINSDLSRSFSWLSFVAPLNHYQTPNLVYQYPQGLSQPSAQRDKEKIPNGMFLFICKLNHSGPIHLKPLQRLLNLPFFLTFGLRAAGVAGAITGGGISCFLET